ncbi:MAG: transporter [Candidatus Peregrinibacteria bacterium]
MSSIVTVFFVGIGLSAITVFADALIKSASSHHAFSGWKLLVAGAFIYGVTAFGWFFVMRRIKLSTLGVLYGVSCVVLLTLVSVFYFREKITTLEIVGIVLAIISLILLSRSA